MEVPTIHVYGRVRLQLWSKDGPVDVDVVAPPEPPPGLSDDMLKLEPGQIIDFPGIERVGKEIEDLRRYLPGMIADIVRDCAARSAGLARDMHAKPPPDRSWPDKLDMGERPE